MQLLGIKVEGILRYRTEDEQTILNEGLTYDQFCALEDQLNTIVQIDFPNIDLGQTINS